MKSNRIYAYVEFTRLRTPRGVCGQQSKWTRQYCALCPAQLWPVEESLNLGVARAQQDLMGFFNLDQAARAFQTLAALGRKYFSNHKTPTTDPDDY